MLASAVFPAKKVGIATIPPYKSTWPSFKSTQYQNSKASHAPRVVMKGKMEGEKRREGLGATLDHYNEIGSKL